MSSFRQRRAPSGGPPHMLTGSIPGREGGRSVQWVTVLLLALASNLDNFGIGIGLGLQRVQLPRTSNGIIALMAGGATGISVFGGSQVASFLPHRWAGLAGGILIALIGGWVVATGGRRTGGGRTLDAPSPVTHLHQRPARPLWDVLRAPVFADVDGSGRISHREAVVLGIATGLNCLAGGFAAGMAGVPAVWIVVLTSVFSYALTALGVRMGRYAGRSWLGRYSNLISGVLLLAIGLYECFS